MKLLKTNSFLKLLLSAGVFLHFSLVVLSQQIHWAKVYPLPKRDAIYCITQDHEGNMYAAGSTVRNIPGSPFTVYNMGFLMKLNSEGDTLYTKELGYGAIFSMAIDHLGIIRINQLSESLNPFFDQLLILKKMSPDGFVFQRDTIQPIPNGMYPLSSIIGKDSSLVVVGQMPRTTNPSHQSMFFLRMHKDGQIDPTLELNPNHPESVANRVEQLPNGHYLVSGYVGSRIASYELNEWGLNPVFKQWYQTPDFSNLYSGHVGQFGNKEWMIGAQGNPSLLGLYDSLSNKIWLRKENAQILPPQAVSDESVVFGFYSGIPPYQALYRIRRDSSYVWNIAFKDSLEARGLPGYVDISSFAYFEDQSAVLAGIYRWDGAGTTNTKEDPIFLRISNVGTPVTSLSKPRKGSLANETLAPWPNPTGGTLYLRQHFDKADIRLYNLAGKEVGHYKIRFGQPINIFNLESGLYLYRAVIDGKGFSGKIIKR